jgi:hypothetical protein
VCAKTRSGAPARGALGETKIAILAGSAATQPFGGGGGAGAAALAVAMGAGGAGVGGSGGGLLHAAIAKATSGVQRRIEVP